MTKRITDLESRLDAAFKRVESVRKITLQRNIYRKAIKSIIGCTASDCEKYVAIVDGIAVEADAKAESL